MNCQTKYETAIHVFFADLESTFNDWAGGAKPEKPLAQN
jgi:hypothetical protein